MTFSPKPLVLTMLLALLPAPQASYASPQYTPQDAKPVYSSEELDQILAPIALYPDPFLAQILPAASFGDQISAAQTFLSGRVDENLIQGQDWDVGVKAIAHYPVILRMLAENPDWTASLGQAYVTQPQDVERSIQRLRVRAEQAGILQSTPEQQVIVEPNYIQIEPAQPQVIYVPEYDPGILWGYSPDTVGLVGFSAGFVIGPWLNRDWDWHSRGPYYHGWDGGGWIRANRRFVDTHNNFYVNDRFQNIHVDRRVAGRNETKFRADLDRDRIARRKPEGVPRSGTPAGGVTPPPPAAAPPETPPPAATPRIAPKPSTAAPKPSTAAPGTTTPPPPRRTAPAPPSAGPQHVTPPAAAPLAAPKPSTAAPRPTTPPPPPLPPRPTVPAPPTAAPQHVTPPAVAPPAAPKPSTALPVPITPPPPSASPRPMTPPPPAPPPVAAPHPVTPPPAAPPMVAPRPAPPPPPAPSAPPAAPQGHAGPAKH